MSIRGSAATSIAAVLLALAAVLGGAPHSHAAPLTYTYEVRGRGNTTSLEDFAARAAETYAHPAGWGLGGSIRFVRVAAGGDFTLWLSAPQYLPGFSSGCSVNYSCRVGRNVIINEARFRGGSPAWNATGAPLRDYQHMVVNHETGHWLGFGHWYCGGPGQLAPVMQQQSKSMQGCRPNPWPTTRERETLARSRGVPIIPPPPPGPPPLAAGSVTRIPVGAAAQGAKAVGINVTVDAPSAPGYLTVFPCGAPVPPTSNLNFAAGRTIAAFTLATPGADGAVCVRTSAPTHLIADLSGYVPAAAGYQPLQPQRLLDTRPGPRRAATVAVRIPTGSQAAALTITATDSGSPGHLTVHPCGQPAPAVSSLNYVPGADVANMVIAQAGAAGEVCISPSSPTHMVVDLIGRYPTGSGFAAMPAQRILDTRSGPPVSGVAATQLPGGGMRIANLTVTDGASPGWARAFPCGAPEPPTSNINYRPGQTVANAMIVPSGQLCVRTSTPTHVIVDAYGGLAAGEYAAVLPVRLLDSRRR